MSSLVIITRDQQIISLKIVSRNNVIIRIRVPNHRISFHYVSCDISSYPLLIITGSNILIGEKKIQLDFDLENLIKDDLTSSDIVFEKMYKVVGFDINYSLSVEKISSSAYIFLEKFNGYIAGFYHHETDPVSSRIVGVPDLGVFEGIVINMSIIRDIEVLVGGEYQLASKVGCLSLTQMKIGDIIDILGSGGRTVKYGK